MKRKNLGLALLCSSATVFLSGCGAKTFEPSELHITKENVAAEAPRHIEDVPKLIRRTASMPSLEYSETQETFDVVVHNVSVRDLLFALVRDLKLNADIDTDVVGVVSISAFDQTFEKILERISRQIPLRYEFIDNVVQIGLDTPYAKQYVVDYLNIQRSFASSSSIENVEPEDGETGGSGSADISVSSTYNFWNQVEAMISEMVLDSYEGNEVGDTFEDTLLSDLANNEGQVRRDEAYFSIDETSGIIVVNASQKIHNQVQEYLDTLHEVAHRQVLLEATIVEVFLDNNYAQGINWGLFSGDGAGNNGRLFANQNAALDINAVLQSGRLDDASFGAQIVRGDVAVAVDLLNRFGDAKVMSSPRISAMNNQGALLRIVDNQYYFEVVISSEEEENEDGTTDTTYTYEVDEEVIPVGFSMSVLPQISKDGQIMLNMRPSLTRVIGEVDLPNLPIAVGEIAVGSKPITRVREFESLLTLNDGEVGVLGGFIEDFSSDTHSGIPGAMDLPGVGGLFENKKEQSRRVQLVIFIKASIIKNPTLHGDFIDYQSLLPDTNFMRRETGNVLFTPEQEKVK